MTTLDLELKNYTPKMESLWADFRSENVSKLHVRIVT